MIVDIIYEWFNVFAGPLTIVGNNAYFQLFVIDPRVIHDFERQMFHRFCGLQKVH